MKPSVKNFLIWFAAVWGVFSVVYIWYDIFQNFKNGMLVSAYESGMNDAYVAVINEANKGCTGFSVTAAEKEVTLISVECLNLQEQQEQE